MNTPTDRPALRILEFPDPGNEWDESCRGLLRERLADPEELYAMGVVVVKANGQVGICWEARDRTKLLGGVGFLSRVIEDALADQMEME